MSLLRDNLRLANGSSVPRVVPCSSRSGKLEKLSLDCSIRLQRSTVRTRPLGAVSFDGDCSSLRVANQRKIGQENFLPDESFLLQAAEQMVDETF